VTTPAAKKEPRVPVPFRVAPAGKAAIQKAAEQAGYDHYTAWIRDLCAAEISNPKHRPRPKEEPR
jgi:hypothetical protein